ncbi:BTB/POZ domain-containing protein 6-B-like [Sitodiplosis mosellana]|uniref:BTB/POZ domain-containing protein 6-B-like n=1 Tax=Sitodiplosis mosellana TaxID=263140 RepID=UPI002443B22E|nr:BTB/POZ domain-containing protein 6-B-like [Sitodiplosis mosellana]
MANVLKSSALSDAIAKMYLNEQLANVHFEFKVNDEIEKVPANKGVLAALSPVFHKMFYGSLTEKGDVAITDADADGFKEFLRLFYMSEVTLTMENMEIVVRLADKYDVLEHVNACATILKTQLTPDNMCWSYQLAVNLKNEEMIEFCEDQIVKSPKEVFASDSFKRCDKSTLKRILELSLICAEVNVFDACLTWAKHACEKNDLDAAQAVNLRTQLGDCLKLIRFGAMTNDEFFKRYVSLKELFTSEEFEDITLTLLLKEHKPKIFNRNPRCYTWDASDVLQCWRKTKHGGSKKYIKTSEITSFSSNNHVLLGKIRTTFAKGHLSKLIGTKIEVTITERKDLAFESTVLPKVLFEYTSLFDSKVAELVVILPQLILIKPQRMYEVRLEVQSPDGCWYYSDCQPMGEMEDGTKIQFHRNPNLDYDNLSNGWISCLYFNKVLD